MTEQKKYKLVIASKAYSSWSLRPWLAMKVFDIPFDEIMISYEHSDWKDRAAQYSPTSLVPVLMDGDLTVHDSLAIFEYLAEEHKHKALWPADKRLRAMARAMCAEMHSGFQDLRKFCPTNFRRALKPRSTPMPASVHAQAGRIASLWRSHIKQFGGPFMFGAEFTLADAMYAPVANRFHAYALSDDPLIKSYIQTLYQLPAYQQWLHDAAAEAHHEIETDQLD